MAKSNDPSNPEELVKYIASCLVENVDKIDIETVELICWAEKIERQRIRPKTRVVKCLRWSWMTEVLSEKLLQYVNT